MCGGIVSAGKLIGCELETGSLPYGESEGFSLCALYQVSAWTEESSEVCQGPSSL